MVLYDINIQMRFVLVNVSSIFFFKILPERIRWASWRLASFFMFLGCTGVSLSDDFSGRRRRTEKHQGSWVWVDASEQGRRWWRFKNLRCRIMEWHTTCVTCVCVCVYDGTRWESFWLNECWKSQKSLKTLRRLNKFEPSIPSSCRCKL